MDMPKTIHRVAYTVNGEGENSRWRAIGVTFENKDGSETVLLDALPANGKLVLQLPKKKEDAEGS
jgi:hypothetical protein